MYIKRSSAKQRLHKAEKRALKDLVNFDPYSKRKD